MHPISILLLGLAMSTDAFAAAVGKGAAMHRPRFPQALRAGEATINREYRKIVSARRLYNFDHKEFALWREAL